MGLGSIRLKLQSFILFLFLFFYFICVQVQLSPFSCHHFPLPYPPYLPPSITPPFDFVHRSFIRVPWWPFPFSNLLDEYHLDPFRKKNCSSRFTGWEGDRLMFSFSLDTLSWSMHTWLGQRNMYKHVPRGVTVVIVHKVSNYGGLFAKYGFVWCECSQHEISVFTSFAPSDGPQEDLLWPPWAFQ